MLRDQVDAIAVVQVRKDEVLDQGSGSKEGGWIQAPF